MSLIKCKQCNGTVATDAEKCPHCGTANYSDDPLKNILKWVGIGLTLYMIYLLFDLGGHLKDMADYLR